MPPIDSYLVPLKNRIWFPLFYEGIKYNACATMYKTDKFFTLLFVVLGFLRVFGSL